MNDYHETLDPLNVHNAVAAVESLKISSPMISIYGSRESMDKKLQDHLKNLTIDNNDLPMDIGNFYQKYILSSDVGLDVRHSSHRSLSTWMKLMESAGLVILRKHFQNDRKFRKRAASKQVIVFGKEHVTRYKESKKLNNCHVLSSQDTPKDKVKQGGVGGQDKLKLQRHTCLTEMQSSIDDCPKLSPKTVIGVGSESVLFAKECKKNLSADKDVSDYDNYDHISIQPTVHAIHRQKIRSITDTDLKRTINDSKCPVKRRRDGVKEITANGITAVISCGQKNKIITTWKENPGDFDYLKRWSENDLSASTGEHQEKDHKKIVTISETFQRHQNVGNRFGRRGKKVQRFWVEGDLVVRHKKKRKNLLVVGLEENVINEVSTLIKKQIGCHVSQGTLNVEAWYAMHGTEFDPLADEGSSIIMINLAEESEVISRTLSFLEQFVPMHCRRYLREEKEEGGLFFINDISTIASSSIIDEQASCEVYTKIAKLYEDCHPEKISEIPGLLSKYRGREHALLRAIERKYLMAVDPRATLSKVPLANDISIQPTKSVNINDLLDDDGEAYNVVPHMDSRPEEDISGYF